MARDLGYGKATVRRWVTSGRLPACRAGHVYRVRRRDLEVFIGSCRVRPQTDIPRRPILPQAVNEARRYERAESGLRALRLNWRSEVAQLGLEPEALLVAFADEYEHHREEPATALLFAVKGTRDAAWLSRHREQVKLAKRLGGAGNVGSTIAALRTTGIEIPIETRRLLEHEAGLRGTVRCGNGHEVPDDGRRFCPECGFAMAAAA